MTIENARRALQSDLRGRASKKKKALAAKKKPTNPTESKKPPIPESVVLTELKEIRALIEAQKTADVDFTITKRDRDGNVKAFKVKQA